MQHHATLVLSCERAFGCSPPRDVCHLDSLRLCVCRGEGGGRGVGSDSGLPRGGGARPGSPAATGPKPHGPSPSAPPTPSERSALTCAYGLTFHHLPRPVSARLAGRVVEVSAGAAPSTPGTPRAGPAPHGAYRDVGGGAWADSICGAGSSWEWELWGAGRGVGVGWEMGLGWVGAGGEKGRSKSGNHPYQSQPDLYPIVQVPIRSLSSGCG